MDKKCPNLYQRARLSTGMSQERAAELLGLSPESLKQYEGGKTVPKDETVAKMVEVYHLPWLALEHAQATDRLGVLPEVNVQSLPTAAITLINRVLDFAAAASHRGGRHHRRERATGLRRHMPGPGRHRGRGASGEVPVGRAAEDKKRTPRGWHLRAFKGKSVWYWINHCWMYQL